jgi:hypothetical protein
MSNSTTPWWLRRALLGIAFWIGHRRAMYRGYPLGESALVAELCNLFFANLSSDLKVVCEVQYTSIFSDSAGAADTFRKTRADICVCRKTDDKNVYANTEFIFEVKRATSTDVESDLVRLATAKKLRPSIRTFLLLISEDNRPKKWVTDKNVGSKKRIETPNADAHCKVRAVMKAIPFFKAPQKAHYACAIEIISD